MNRNTHKLFQRIITILLLISFIEYAYTLETDPSQPLHIQADSAELNGKKGTTVYSGNVILSQGSLTINANTVNIHIKNKKLEKITATGSPVKMNHKPSLNDDNVTASANTISYLPRKKTITLKGNASLEQAGKKFSSEYISYHLVKKNITAQSSKNRDNRVHVIIPPN